MKLTAQDIKDKLNIDDVCAVVESLGGTRKGETGKDIIYSSISHNLDADDGTHKSKLYLHKDDLTFTDYVLSCTFDIFELVKKRKSLQGLSYNFPQCIKYVCDITGIECEIDDESIKHIYNWSKLKKYLRHNHNIEDLKEYNVGDLKLFSNKYHQSWIDEGFSIDILNKWGIKWYDYKQQIVIPVYDNQGILRGIRARNIIPDMVEDLGKYIPLRTLTRQYNFPSSQILYGENYHWENIRHYKTAILVESEKSVIKSDMWDDKSCTVAMLGHNLSTYNLKRLLELGVNEIVIGIDWDWIDRDEQYDKYCDNVNKIYDKCSPYCKVSVLYNPKDHNDYYKWSPYDFKENQFEWMWNNRKLLTK